MAGTTWVWEPPAGADVLFAPGAPFEIATEPVLGVDCKVFKNRLGNIREVMTVFTARHGDLPNLVFPEITLSFNDVQASTARVAAWFAERGVVKGDRVAFAAANVAPYVIGWWATLASGAIVSSLNGWWTPAELLHGVELSKPGTPKV
jgi:acyl-CoA synthetase (AMP-forming)/AMP-acid ligase II